MARSVLLEVVVDLDDVPGEFHTKESAKAIVQQILRQQIPQYNPLVFCTQKD